MKKYFLNKKMKNKKIYKILKELEKIWITDEYKKIIMLYETEVGFSEEDIFKDFSKIFDKKNKNNILSNFIYDKEKYFSYLKKEEYIEIIKINYEYSIDFPILTDKGKIFLENYENRNILDKFEDFVKIYPNSIKIFLWFILWIISTIITIYIKSLTK